MAIVRALQDGEGQWFVRGEDHGKPVRVNVHALTKEEERKARQAAYGNKKASKVHNESIHRAVDRGEAFTRERAILALDQTENWNVDIPSEEARQAFVEVLGPGVVVEVGKELCLDGRWTEGVRRLYFTAFAFSKDEAKEISDLSGKVGKRDLDEEEEATADFARP